MAEIINLNRARKARAKTTAKINAAANRAKFGQSKTEKQAEAAERARAERELDGAKRD
ncbi:DUF4169 family protein [Sphingomonas xinjiangensis]|uniref:DUF4169 domain-containing protein n=1 Tax=Sphingomonas xinjiangensis TaxID=643568 RepID=A0A840YGV4_9SPHN|nr:DUF4169 family protein [Sphingomonas xinjiangensis]MBB5711219.1 hypothetical protein [Sphingomonas xinjiangensis]